MDTTIELGTTRRGKQFRWFTDDRSTHMQVIGASGRGKSKLLEDMLRQDISNIHKPGLLLIDPHGKLYNDLIHWASWNGAFKNRKVHLLNPSQEGWSVGFNPLRTDPAITPAVRVDAMVQACAQVWGGENSSRTPLLKKCLRAVFFALTAGNQTLLEATELVSASDRHNIRKHLTGNLNDRVFQSIWDDFNNLAAHFNTRRQFVEQFSSTNNRLMEFLASPTIRDTVGQRDHVIDFRACMEQGDIVLVNLAPSPDLSIDNARLLGTLMLNDVLVSALGRNPMTAPKQPFYVYIDECYDYLTGDVEKMLDQTRKFGVHLVLSHQRLGQLREAGDSIYNAVMTGAQTKVVFGGLTKPDADEMADDIFLGELDLEKGVELTKNPVVVGQNIEWLRSEMDSETVSESFSRTSSDGGSETVTEILNADGEVTGQTVSAGVSSGSSESSSKGRAHTHADGRHEALVSEFQDRYGSVHGLDKIKLLAVTRLANQPKRRAIVKVPGHHSAAVTVRQVDDPPYNAERVERDIADLLGRSPYLSTTAQVEQEIDIRYKLLIEDANPQAGDSEEELLS